MRNIITLIRWARDMKDKNCPLSPGLAQHSQSVKKTNYYTFFGLKNMFLRYHLSLIFIVHCQKSDRSFRV